MAVAPVVSKHVFVLTSNNKHCKLFGHLTPLLSFVVSKCVDFSDSHFEFGSHHFQNIFFKSFLYANISFQQTYNKEHSSYLLGDPSFLFNFFMHTFTFMQVLKTLTSGMKSNLKKYLSIPLKIIVKAKCLRA